MYTSKTILEHLAIYSMIHRVSRAVKKKDVRRHSPPLGCLLLSVGLTVSTLVLSGVCLVGTHQDPVQRAVILGIAVISTLLDGALDALVCMTVHIGASFVFGFDFSMAQTRKTIQEISPNLAFFIETCYPNKKQPEYKL